MSTSLRLYQWSEDAYTWCDERGYSVLEDLANQDLSELVPLLTESQEQKLTERLAPLEEPDDQAEETEDQAEETPSEQDTDTSAVLATEAISQDTPEAVGYELHPASTRENPEDIPLEVRQAVAYLGIRIQTVLDFEVYANEVILVCEPGGKQRVLTEELG